MAAPTLISPSNNRPHSLGDLPVTVPAKDLHGTSNKRPTIIIFPTVSPESVIVPIVSCILGFPLLALMVICCLRRRAKLASHIAKLSHTLFEAQFTALVAITAADNKKFATNNLPLNYAIPPCNVFQYKVYDGHLPPGVVRPADESIPENFVFRQIGNRLITQPSGKMKMCANPGCRERARRRNCGMTSAGLSLVRLGAGRVARTPSIAKVGRDRPSLDLATVLEERSDPEQTQIELMTPDRDDRLQLSRLLSQPARYFLEGGR